MAIASSVYIRTDNRGIIIRCEGGYTVSNIHDFSDWILIDSGNGDRYNLCQSHYFDGGLYTEDNIARWRYTDGACVLRPVEEIEADRAERPQPEPTVTIPTAEYADMQTALAVLGVTDGE